MSEYEEVTRFEIIDRSGKVYSNWNVENIEFSLQDNGKTLKIFLKDNIRQFVECDI